MRALALRGILAALLGVLPGCGFLTAELWHLGTSREKKHWVVRSRQLAAVPVLAGAGGAANCTLLSTEPGTVTGAWQDAFGERATATSPQILLRPEPDASEKLRAGATLVPTRSRIVIRGVRDAGGQNVRRAYWLEEGSLALAELVRMLPESTPREATASDPLLASVRERFAAIPWATWLHRTRPKTERVELLGISDAKGAALAATCGVDAMLARGEPGALREIWLHGVAISAHGRDTFRARADTLYWSSVLALEPSGDHLMWQRTTRWRAELAPEGGPGSESRPGTRTAQVTFQWRELVRPKGDMSTFVKVLLTPLAVTADIVTLGTATVILGALFPDEDITWEWDEKLGCFVVVVGCC